MGSKKSWDFAAVTSYVRKEDYKMCPKYNHGMCTMLERRESYALKNLTQIYKLDQVPVRTQPSLMNEDEINIKHLSVKSINPYL